MMSLPQIAAAVTAVVTIGGTAVALDKLHVPAAEFEQYLEQQQVADARDYVQKLKKEIRDVRAALIVHPGDEYLVVAMADLVDELCEFRPDDRLCEEE